MTADKSEVAGLPWELLYRPELKGPMAMLNMPIVRYLPQLLHARPLKVNLPLNVLLTGAHTPAPLSNLPRLTPDETTANIERELRDIREALSHLGDRVHITIEEHLTPEKLRELLQKEFYVWYFVGHGSIKKDGTAAQLQFEKGVGGTNPVSPNN